MFVLKDTIAFVKHWLDDQWEKTNGSASVIYLAFGSIARFVPEQITEIADAISPYPLVWSLDGQSQLFLTPSFKEDRSHLILDWAPQRLILLHPAVRLFVSHGGWNSLVEGMLGGKPILIWPRFGDQFSNGYRLEHEFKNGRMIANSTVENQHRTLPSYEITQYIIEIFQREEIYTKAAREMRKMLTDAQETTSRKHLEEIVDIIENQEVSRTKNRHEL